MWCVDADGNEVVAVVPYTYLVIAVNGLIVVMVMASLVVNVKAVMSCGCSSDGGGDVRSCHTYIASVPD